MEGGVVPVGFRFYPTEEELVSFYLHNKLHGSTRPDLLHRVIPLLYIYDFHPSHLPKYAGVLCHEDSEQWFFFIPRQEKEARGGRPNRLTNTGYWKATGSPGYVYSSTNRVIGMKRTMVFYGGRAPSGRKTEWKMNEYRAIEGDHQASSSTTTTTITQPPKLRQEFSLCRVYKKSKCLRAFDRRPSASMVGHEASTLLHLLDHQGNEGTTTSHHHHQNHPTVERTSSSSSAELDPAAMNTPSQAVESTDNNWDGALNNEPMWDWEQLNLI